MRALICIGLAALTLGACGGGDSAENRAATEQNVTSEIAATNDVTAIDAATGQAANMAADVDYLPDEMNAAEANNNSASAAEPARRPSATRSTARTTSRPPAAEPRASEPAEEPANANTL